MTQKNNKRIRLFTILFLWVFIAVGFSPTSAQTPGNPPLPNQPTYPYNLFLPFTIKPLNIVLGDIELTQSIQNMSNTVSLVAGRTSLARVYIRSTTSSQISGVSAMVKGYRGATYLGQVGPFTGTAYPNSVSIDTMRADKNKSINVSLPSNWISSSGTLTLDVTFNDSTMSPELEANSPTYSRNFYFNSVPALQVVAVPVKLYSPDGTFGPASTTYMTNALFRMYPVPSVNVTVHSTFNYAGDMSSGYSWSDLLGRITTMRNSEVGESSSVVYYGIIPLRDSSGFTWFPPNGGIVGLGWISDRVAIGVSTESFQFPQYPGWDFTLAGADTAAHEIGHNFGRLHVDGCGADNTDSGYPYPNGEIGQFGYRFSDQVVIQKTENDIMNYCDDQWISDYTYQALFENQTQMAQMESLRSKQNSLFVRADFSGGSSVQLLPTYVFDANIASAEVESEYSIELLDVDGALIAVHPVRVFTAEEKEISVQSIHANLPLPGKPVASLRLLHNGQEIASRSLQSLSTDALAAAQAPQITSTGSQLQLTWGSPELPALVSYSSDGGASWSTLAVDAEGGSLSLDLADFPTSSLLFRVYLADQLSPITLEWNN